MEAVLISEKKEQDVENTSVSMETEAQSKTTHPDVWALKTSDDPKDQIRLGLFLQLLEKLTVNVTDRLPEFQKRLQIDNKQRIYQFAMEQETEEGAQWIKSNWKLLNDNFYTRDFYRTKTRQRLVLNVIRHCIKWINTHYNLKQPLFYVSKNVKIRDQETDKTVMKKISYLSF
jgi:hypothetical protein